MKIILLILSIVFITASVMAQVPESMSYQAVVRNGKNELIANRQIGLRISIIQGIVNGPEVYREVFHPNPVTNANGLFTAEIGSTYLAPVNRGTDLNARMKRLLFTHGFVCGLKRIALTVDVRNARSQAARISP